MEERPAQLPERKTAPVLGHTNFSWTYKQDVVPLGHTPFSWSGGTRQVSDTNSATLNKEKEKEADNESQQSNQKQPKQKGKAGKIPPTPAAPPLKVLCLHGYLQSGPIWEKKTSSFRRCFNKYKMEFVVPTAPHKMQQLADDGSPTFKWLETVPEFDGSPKFLTCLQYKGMKKTLKFLQQFIADNGPFDGIIGFSQGAIVASLLLAMCNPPVGGEKKKTARLRFNFRFGITIAGYPAPALDFKVVYDRLQKHQQGVSDVPTLHVWGVKDDLVPPEHSRLLVDLFANAQHHEHTGGHVAPNNAEARKAYHTFLDGVLGTS